MSDSCTTGTRDEWLKARLDLLKAEKELTRHGDEIARQRQALPWVRSTRTYRFDTEQGSKSLADLFGGRSQLLVYHFMFGPDYKAGCVSCSAIADGFNGIAVHLANHDVNLWAVSRAPLAKLLDYQQTHGLDVPVGVVRRRRLQLRLQRRRSPRKSSATAASSTTTRAAATRWTTIRNSRLSASSPPAPASTR